MNHSSVSPLWSSQLTALQLPKSASSRRCVPLWNLCGSRTFLAYWRGLHRWGTRLCLHEPLPELLTSEVRSLAVCYPAWATTTQTFFSIQIIMIHSRSHDLKTRNIEERELTTAANTSFWSFSCKRTTTSDSSRARMSVGIQILLSIKASAWCFFSSCLRRWIWDVSAFLCVTWDC